MAAIGTRAVHHRDIAMQHRLEQLGDLRRYTPGRRTNNHVAAGSHMRGGTDRGTLPRLLAWWQVTMWPSWRPVGQRVAPWDHRPG